jgi:formylglycine-generating enzyme required for sulfatase activity
MDRRLRELQQRYQADPGDAGLARRLTGALGRLADLTERTRWAEAPDRAQDLVLAVVADLLGPEYSLRGAKLHAAGGASHRIGAFLHRGSGVLLHLIPGGAFRMGSERDTELELPVRRVVVPPLLVGRYPVLQHEWDRVGGVDERTWEGSSLPIEGVSWHDAQDWLRRAGGGLRLPSEAEWEYACRAGTATHYFWGDAMRPDHCWFGQEGRWTSHPPEAHDGAANAFGLVDVSGNLAEWCEDAYVSNYRGAPKDGSPRRRGWSARLFGDLRVVRGGDAFNRASHCRSARRSMTPAGDRGAGIGLRVARSAPLLGLGEAQSATVSSPR